MGSMEEQSCSPTLENVIERLDWLEEKLDRILVNQDKIRRFLRKEESDIMAQIDDVVAEIKTVSDNLTQFNTDFDAAVALLKAGQVPTNLQPAVDALTALQAQLDATDAKAKALSVTPSPVPQGRRP